MPGSDYDRLPSDLQELVDELEAILRAVFGIPEDYDLDGDLDAGFQDLKDTLPGEMETLIETALNDNIPGLFQNENNLYEPTDDLLFSNDNESMTASPTYIKCKEIEIKESMDPDSEFRIKFAIKTNDPGAPTYGYIYKNGTPIGSEQSNATTGYVVKSQDLGPFERGDLIALYVKNPNEGAGWYKELRIYGKIQNFENKQLTH